MTKQSGKVQNDNNSWAIVFSKPDGDTWIGAIARVILILMLGTALGVVAGEFARLREAVSAIQQTCGG